MKSKLFQILLLLLSLHVYGQQLLPPAINYSTKDYNAASQNWGMCSDENGTIYAANYDGLLQYDGQRWKLFKLPNKTIIRSVFCQGDRIYTGSYEEFGYWEPDGYGSLNYISLTRLIKDSPFENEEFWEITAYKEGIAFRSFGKLYLYENSKISSYKPNFFITSFISNTNGLILGSSEGKLYRFNQGKIEPYSKNYIKNNNSIIALAEINKKIIVGTRLGGLYSLKNNRLTPWGTERLNKFLIKNELNKIEVFDKNKIVFGTIKGGIFSYNEINKEWQNYHRTNGLQNNTVLSLNAHNNTLWVGLDNGIDAINLNAPIRYYSDTSGELGAVYDIAYFDERIYLASNTGIHYFENGTRQFLTGSQGHVWNFSHFGGMLFANHNRGLFKVSGKQLINISNESGSYGLEPIPSNPDYFLNATYNGIEVYKTENGSVQFVQKLEKPNTPIENLIFQDKNTLWAHHPYKGFFRLKFNSTTNQIESLKSLGHHAVFSAFKTEIHKIENQVTFQNSGNWYNYNTIKDTIENLPALKNYTDFSLLNEVHSHYWFKNRNGTGIIYTDFKLDSLFISEPLLENRLIKGYEKIVALNDSVDLISLNEGYASINMNLLMPSSERPSVRAPLLNKFSDEVKTHLLATEFFEIKNEDSSQIAIAVSAPYLQNPHYKYSLSNGTIGSLINGNLKMQNLKPDDYELKIWSVENGISSAEPLQINFEVLPPWYLSTVLKAIYIVLLLLVILLIYIINKRKLNQHRRLVEQKLLKEQQRKTQIAEHNELVKDIQTKRKELANSTFRAAKRNQTLQEVKKELEKIKESFDNRYKYKNLQTKLNSIIEGKDNWKIFETNFKEVHDDFFHELLQEHPKLSNKDLKLCAYLKMNLSSKEIASLMDISVRGVETHRYRLRKKLDLDSNISLTKFIIKNY